MLLNHPVILKQHAGIWKDALPYLDIRQNDKHTLYCYAFAKKLLEHHPEANKEVVLLGILLHDVGWKTVPEDKILFAFGPHQKYPELQVQHEKEGVKIATQIMQEHNTQADLIKQVTSIIDGHDTRKESLSLEDSLVKDADKLWRYTPFGLTLIAEWFNYNQQEQLELLDKWLKTRFYTDTAVHIASGLLCLLSLQPTETNHA